MSELRRSRRGKCAHIARRRSAVLNRAIRAVMENLENRQYMSAPYLAQDDPTFHEGQNDVGLHFVNDDGYTMNAYADWGDGSDPEEIDGFADGDGYLSLSHNFSDDGSTVSVTVDDSNGNSSTYQWGVQNLPPTVSGLDVPSEYNGWPVYAHLDGLSDSDTDLNSMHYSFASNADDLAPDYGSASATGWAGYSFNLPGTYPIYGMAYDKDGGISDAVSGQIHVTDADLAPQGSLYTSGPVEQGQDLTAYFVGVYDSRGLTPHYSISDSPLPADAPDTGSSVSLNFDTAGVYTIYGRLWDDGHPARDFQTQVIVREAAPSLDVEPVSSPQEGLQSDWTLSDTVHGDNKVAQWTVDWGDGTDPQTYTNVPDPNGQSVQTTTVSHTYSLPGTYHIHASAKQSDGNVYSASPATVDPTFGTAGVVHATLSSYVNNDSWLASARQSDGKIVMVTGFWGGFLVARYDENGNLDEGFGDNGTVISSFPSHSVTPTSVVVDPNGMIVVAGPADGHNLAIARYSSDGQIDTTFGNGGTVVTSFSVGSATWNSSGQSVTVGLQTDGSDVTGITVAGWLNGNTADAIIAHYTPSGILDTTFGSAGKVTDSTTGAAATGIIEPEGKTVIAGANGLVRYNTDGTLDTSFGVDGFVSTSAFGSVTNLAPQPDGKLIVEGFTSGTFDGTTGMYSGGFSIARYNVDGTLDLSFGQDGTHYTAVVFDWAQFQYGNYGLTADFGPIAQRGDGTFQITGMIGADWGDQGIALVSYDADGNIDPNFATNGLLLTAPRGESPLNLYVQNDELLAVGRTWEKFTFGPGKQVTVNNVNPSVTVGDPNDNKVNEGETYVLKLSASDPGEETVTQWVVDWGDGTVGNPDLETIPGDASSATHVYDDSHVGVDTIKATVHEDDGESADNTFNLTVLPAAPTGLVATAVSSSEIDLSWLDNADTTDSNLHYVVQESTNGSSFTTIASSLSASTESYQVTTGLTTGTPYDFRVYATRSTGDSEYSNTASETTLGAGNLPTTITDLQASFVTDHVALSWSDVSNETAYTVQKRDGLDGQWTDLITTLAAGSGGSISYDDYSQRDPDHTYYYRVFGTNSVGAGALSNQASYTTSISAPTNLTGDTSVSGQVTLTWYDNADNEENFKIYRWDTTHPTPVVYAIPGSSGRGLFSYTITGLSTLIYGFKVIASTSTLESDGAVWSEGTLPDVPADLGASINGSMISLTWTDSTGEDHYTVQKRDGLDGLWTTLTTTVAANSVGYNDDGEQDPEHTYYYRVFATNSAGPSDASNEASVTTSITAPDNLQASGADDDNVVLTWQDNSENEEGFNIYQWDNTDSTKVLIGTLPAHQSTGSVSFTVGGLDIGPMYSFEVKAFIGATELSAGSVNVTPVDQGITAEGPTTANYGDYEVLLSSPGISGSLDWTIDWGDGTSSSFSGDASDPENHPLTSTHHYSEPSDDSTSLFTISVEAKYGTTTWYADDLNVEMSDGGGAQLGPVVTPADTRKAILEAFQEVYNTIRFEPYLGLKKGAAGVEQTKAGNDWDQAALLKQKIDAILGYANDPQDSPVKYVYTVITAPTTNVMRWLGVSDGTAAQNVLSEAGVYEGTYGTTMKIDHAWIRIPKSVTGTTNDWDLDPSWKYQVGAKRSPGAQADINNIGTSAAASTVFDPVPYAAASVTEDPLQWYETQISNYIRNSSNLKGRTSLADLSLTGAIIGKTFLTAKEQASDYILPPQQTEYTTDSNIPTVDFSTLGNMDHHVLFTVSVTGGPSKQYDIDMPTEGNSPVLVRYTLTPTFTGDPGINSGKIRAELYIGDITFADRKWSMDIPISSTVNYEIEVFGPKDQVTRGSPHDFQKAAGAPVALMLNAGQFGIASENALQHTLNELGAKKSLSSQEAATYQGLLLEAIAERYAYNQETEADHIGDITETVPVHGLVEFGIVSGVNVSQKYISSLQNPWVFYDATHGGIATDLPGLEINYISAQSSSGYGAKEDNAFRVWGYASSWLESSAIEGLTNSEAMSTVKGFQWAASNGYSILKITESNVSLVGSLFAQDIQSGYVTSSWAGSVRSEILTSITTRGGTVFVPSRIVRSKSWTGVVWDEEDSDGRSGLIRAVGEATSHGGVSIATPSPLPSFNLFQPQTNNAHVIDTKGDPVNMFTGGLYDDETDFSLPDPGLPLTFARHYSSTQNGTLNKDTWATNPLITNTADPNVGTTGPLGSNSDDQGMGVGWTYSYSDRLIGIGTSKVTWITSQGDRYEFDQIGTSSKFYDPSGLFGDFTFAGTGTSKIYTYREKDGTQHIFDYTGKLTKIKDRNNNELDIAHDNAGGLISSVSYKGPSDSNSTRIITFVVTDYHISSVTDFTGRTWAFTYSAPHFANGGVYLTDAAAPTTATGSGAIPKLHTQYSYKNDQGDSRDGLLKEIDRHTATGTGATRGSQKYEYYANGRVFSTTDADGHTEYFSYDSFRSTLSGSNAPVYTASANHTDFNGNTTESVFNENGLLTRTINPDGSRTDQTWMAYKLADNANAPTGFLLRASTNEVGLTNWFNYKGEKTPPSNATSYRLVDSGNVDTQWSNTTDFDPAAPDTHPGWDQPHITFSYDPKFNGVTTIATAGSVGVKATRTTTNVYDGNGNLTSTTDPVLGKTTFTYYGNGLLHTKMLPNGNAAPDTPTKNAYTITYNYFDGETNEDDSGLLKDVTQNGTTLSSYTYDLFGNLLTQKDGTNRETDYQYDLLGRKKSQTIPDPDGPSNPLPDLVTNYTWYDNEIINVTMPGTDDTPTITTVNTYDKVGRLIGTSTLGAITSTTYDSMGNAISSTDANNNVTQYIYDNRNRLVETLYSDGGYAINVYDGAGRIVQTITPSSTVQDYRFDPQAVTSTAYDSLGHVDNVVDPVNQETKNTYDGIGDLTETQFFTQAGDTTPFTTTIYKVDSLGRVIARYGTDGVATTTQYDPDGNVIQSIQYDVTGTSSSVQKSDLESSTLDLHHMGLTNKRITSTRYDNFDRPIAVLDPMGNVTRTYYDNAGRVTKTVDPRASSNITPTDTGKPGVDYTTQSFWTASVPSAASETNYATSFDYDGVGRLKTKTLPSANGSNVGDIEYTYYPNGSLKSQTDANTKTTTYTYDLANHLTTRHDPLVTDVDGTTHSNYSYTTHYNLDGTVDYETDERGDTTSYDYDSRERVIKKDPPDPNTGQASSSLATKYVYDQAGNLVDTIDPTGVDTRKSYDALGRVVRTSVGASPAYALLSASFGNDDKLYLNTNGPSGAFTPGDTIVIDNFSWTENTTNHVTYQLLSSVFVPGGAFQVTDAATNNTGAYVTLARLPASGNDMSVSVSNDYSSATITKVLSTTSTVYTDNQVTQTTDANGNRTTTDYAFFDGTGPTAKFNRTVTQYQAAPSVSGHGSRISTESYDALGELVQAETPTPITADTVSGSGNGKTIKFTTTAAPTFKPGDLVNLGNISWTETTTPVAGGSGTTVTVPGGVFTVTAVGSNYVTIHRSSPTGTNLNVNFPNGVAGATVVNGGTTIYTYDLDGRVIKQVDPPKSGNAPVTVFGYDAAGNQIYVLDPSGGAMLNSSTTAASLAMHMSSSTPATPDPIHATFYQYDAQNHKTDEYDADPDATTVLSNGSQTSPHTKWTYDANGNVKTMTDPSTSSTNMTTYSYDELNRLKEEDATVYENSSDDNHKNAPVTRKYFYDGVGNNTEIIDRDNHATTFNYDHLDRMIQENWFNGPTTSGSPAEILVYKYDADNRQLSAFTNRDPVHNTSNAGTPDVSYAYDDLGQATLITQHRDELNNGLYPQYSDLTPLEDINLIQQFDPNGNRTQVSAVIQYPESDPVPDFVNQYLYNELDQMTRIYQPANADAGVPIGSKLAVFSPNLLGQTGTIQAYKNVSTGTGTGGIPLWQTSSTPGTELTAAKQQWNYDAGGTLSTINGFAANGTTPIEQYSYQWNVNGTMSSMHVNGAIRSFGYDSNDQLTSEPSKSYGYDSNGNRISGPGAAVTSGVGADNRIKEDADWKYEYDGEGNLTKKISKATATLNWHWDYTYDNRNRMTEADWKDPNGNLRGIERNQYDAVDWRTSRYWVNYLPTITGGMEYYVYDPAGGSDNPGAPGSDDVALVLDSGGGVSERYLWGPNPDQLLAGDVARNGSRVTEWYSGDHEGSIRQVVDNASNRVVQVMDYDAFGNLISASLPSSVHAYSTGSAGDGSGGDSHWTILGGSVTTQRHATIVTTPSSAWVSAPSGSQWIGIHSDNTSDGQLGPDSSNYKLYTYTTTITIDAGSTVSSISGMLAVDNELTGVTVNGTTANLTVSSSEGAYTRWHGFTLSGLHAGSNTVVFTVKDWGGSTGLAVEWGQTQANPSDTTQLPRFLFQGMMWDNTPQLYEMGSGIDYVDPKTNRRLSQDPAREGTNLYAIEANNDNSNRDYNGMNTAFGGTLFGYLDPTKLSVTNINVGGNFGTSSPSELNLSGTYLADSGAGMFSAGGGSTRRETATYSPIDPVLNTQAMVAFNYAVQLNNGYDPNANAITMSPGMQLTTDIARYTAMVALGTAATIATGGLALSYLGGGMLGAVGTGAVSGGAGALVSNVVWQGTGSQPFNTSQLLQSTAVGFATGGVLGGAGQILTAAGRPIAQYLSNLMNPPGAVASNGAIFAGAGPTITSGVISGPQPGILGSLVGDLTTLFSTGRNSVPVQNHHGIPHGYSGEFNFNNHPLVQQAKANLYTDPRNQFDLANHVGGHSNDYLIAVKDVLDAGSARVAGAGQQAADAELGRIMADIQRKVYDGTLRPYVNKDVWEPSP